MGNRRSLKCGLPTFNSIGCSENSSNNSWNCNLNNDQVNCNWNNKNNRNRIVPFFDSAIRIVRFILWNIVSLIMRYILHLLIV